MDLNCAKKYCKIFAMKGMTPELRTVFDIVSDLRLEAGSSIFSFKLSDILTRLDKSKDSIKYGIGVFELKQLLDDLATQYGVQLDYVEEADLGDNRVDYRWKYGEYEWVYLDVQVGQDIRDFFGKYYINIDTPQIKAINDATVKKYDATLGYEEPSFTVTCNGRRYTLPGLTDGRPFKILNHIMENGLTNKIVGRNKLADCIHDDKLKDLSFTTDVFESNNQVKVLEPFIKIKPVNIAIYTSVKLTALELQTIINACK